MKKNIPIIYKDEHLLVVNKPAGLLTIPDRYDPDKPNVRQLLSEQYEEVFVVHRLDRCTSGVLCLARTADAHRDLSRQFEERSVHKLYLALVEGAPQPAEDTIDQGIARHPTQPGKMVISNKGKNARTRYKIVESFRSCSLAEVNIETGRTHQIRVHFAGIGHPLLVDPIYGRRDAFFLSEIKGRRYNLGRDKVERPLISRTSLHASQLTLRRPDSGEECTFKAPLPKDMRACLNQLRKWAQA